MAGVREVLGEVQRNYSDDVCAQALIKDAAITEGQNVLDVADGPGEPSLTITETW